MNSASSFINFIMSYWSHGSQFRGYEIHKTHITCSYPHSSIHKLPCYKKFRSVQYYDIQTTGGWGGGEKHLASLTLPPLIEHAQISYLHNTVSELPTVYFGVSPTSHAPRVAHHRTLVHFQQSHVLFMLKAKRTATRRILKPFSLILFIPLCFFISNCFHPSLTILCRTWWMMTSEQWRRSVLCTDTSQNSVQSY